jgi:hypothetical protein
MIAVMTMQWGLALCLQLGTLGWDLQAYLDVTALARVASSTDARVAADVIHACPSVDTRRGLALIVLVFTVLAGEACYTTQVHIF